jgi:hypothetical protein
MKTERIVVRKLGHIIDVFHGEEGFESQHWTRFLLVRGFLKFIKGSQMSSQDMRVVKQQLGV